MRKILFISICFLFKIGDGVSQQIPETRFFVSFSAGPAIPVGSFAKDNIQEASLFLEKDPIFLGIDKSEAGFAKTGFNYRLHLEYLLNPKVFTFLRFGGSNNQVDTAELQDFFTDRFRGEVKFEHDDYKISTLLSGFGYRLNERFWNLSLGFAIGYGQTNYPYYQVELLYTLSNPKLIYSHSPSAEQPNLNSLVFSGLMNIHYKKNRFKFGLETTIEHASFDYQMSNGVPGTTYWPYSNTLKTSLFNAGISVGYSFGL